MKRNDLYEPLAILKDTVLNLSDEEKKVLDGINGLDDFKKRMNNAISSANTTRIMLNIDYSDKEFNVLSDKQTNKNKADWILWNWRKNKQVFKFDADFLRELLKTEAFELTSDIISRIPYSTFYIDLPNAMDINGIHDGKRLCASGVFVHSSRNENGENTITSIIITDRDSSGNRYVIDLARQKEILELVSVVTAYLCSDMADLQESIETKHTYKKSQFIKDKFSEVHITDVGVRYGASLREWKRKYEYERVEGAEHGDENLGTRFSGKQRPHYRKAHFHTYWVGKGRTERRIHWINELGININLGTETDVVIHKNGRKRSKDAVEIEQ